jgi:transcriptional regulator with XRE-family HTH domain
MPSGGRFLDQALRRATRIRLTAGEDIRRARLGAGLSQTSVANAARVSQSLVSKVESGTLRSVSLETLVVIADAVGLDIACRAYPGRKPTRDAAHARTLQELLKHVTPPMHYSLEWPLPPLDGIREKRAWDAVLLAPDGMTGVELEMRLYDVQDQTRRLMLKWRDSGVNDLLLLVNDTAANRAVIRTFPDYFKALPRLRTAAVLNQLDRGERPLSGLMLLSSYGPTRE